MGFLDGLLGQIPVIGPIASAVGNIFGGTNAARTTNTSGTSTSNVTGASTPTIAPGYQSLADLLNSRAASNLQNTDLSGYTTGGISNINNTYKNIGLSNNANLTARGLASSPVAAAVQAKTNMARGGDIASFENSIPLLQNQLTNQGINSALSVIGGLGKGTSTTGTSTGTTTGTSTGPGSTTGNMFGSAGELLAYLNGKGLLGPPPTQTFGY